MNSYVIGQKLVKEALEKADEIRQFDFYDVTKQTLVILLNSKCTTGSKMCFFS